MCISLVYVVQLLGLRNRDTARSLRGVMLIYIYVKLIVYGSTVPSGPGPPHCRSFTITLRHTTLGGAPLDE